MSEGLKLAAIYGYLPCRLGLCGRKVANAPRILADFLIGCGNEAEARDVLEKFEAAFRYYELIAQENEIDDVFDKKVVEAYWLGNELLNKVCAKALQKMILEKFGQACAVKAHHKPTHSFHVYVLGSISINLPEHLQDLCAVSIGQAQDFSGQEVVLTDGKKIVWDKCFLEQIKKGDWLSSHWNHACQVLGGAQAADFRKFNALRK